MMTSAVFNWTIHCWTHETVNSCKTFKEQIFFQRTFSTAQIHILCFKACQILIFSVIRFEVGGCREENIPNIISIANFA